MTLPQSERCELLSISVLSCNLSATAGRRNGSRPLADTPCTNDRYRYGSNYEKTPFYSNFKADRDGLMSTLGNHAHAVLRRAESPAYTMTLLVELEELVDSCLDDLTGLFDREIEAGEGKATIEMAETLQLVSSSPTVSAAARWVLTISLAACHGCCRRASVWPVLWSMQGWQGHPQLPSHARLVRERSLSLR